MGGTPAHPIRLFGSALGLAACLTAAGCADLPKTSLLAPPDIDETSPVARQVAAASNNQADFPSFRDMPREPTDIRPAGAWTRSVYDTIRLRRQMQVLAAVAGPARTDTDAFVKSSQAYTAAPGAKAETHALPDKETSSFVQGARERATPPSPSR